MDANGLSITPDFVSEAQESHLITETDRTWRHTKYEYSHWDNVSQFMFFSSGIYKIMASYSSTTKQFNMYYTSSIVKYFRSSFHIGYCWI